MSAIAYKYQEHDVKQMYEAIKTIKASYKKIYKAATNGLNKTSTKELVTIEAMANQLNTSIVQESFMNAVGLAVKHRKTIPNQIKTLREFLKKDKYSESDKKAIEAMEKTAAQMEEDIKELNS